MLKELIRAFLLIFVAEMGDKTQIIAMTFATKYSIKQVILGVIIGVFFNHGLAIMLGRYLSNIVPMNYLQILAGIMFVLFGILALRDEEVEEDGPAKSYGPIITVALAFFIGELGDKTQLTAMSLSAEGSYPLFILGGTILGMVATSSLGIFVGSKIGNKIEDIYIKIVSSLVFIFFGTLKLYGQVPGAYKKAPYILIYFVLIFLVEAYLMRKLVRKSSESKTEIQKAAERLYLQNQVLSNAIEDICLGEDSCGSCKGLGCIIGYTNYLLSNARENEKYYNHDELDLGKLESKNFDREKLIKALVLILKDYDKNGFIHNEDFIVNRVKSYLEYLLFNERIEGSNLEQYLSRLRLISEDSYLEIKKELD